MTECRLAPDCLCRQATMQGEIGRLDVNNPNYILELGVGPPVPNLVPQQPGTGAVLAGEQRGISIWTLAMTQQQLPLTPVLPHAHPVQHVLLLAATSSVWHELARAVARPVPVPTWTLHLQESACLSRRLQVRGRRCSGELPTLRSSQR